MEVISCDHPTNVETLYMFWIDMISKEISRTRCLLVCHIALKEEGGGNFLIESGSDVRREC